MKKTVSLCITGGKVTARLLKQAMMRFLAAMEKEKARESKKTAGKGTARQRLSWKAEFKEAGTAECSAFQH